MRVLILLLVLPALFACGSLLPPAPALSVYTLAPSTASPTPAAIADWQLLIEPPMADGLLAGNRIVVRSRAGDRGVLDGVRWSDTAPTLVQSALIRAFEDAGVVRGVGRSGDVMRGDYVLAGDLRTFQLDHSADARHGRVDIVLSARLLSVRDGRVVGSRVLSATEVVADGGAAAVIAAFDVAFAGLQRDLVTWTLDRVAAGASANPAAE